MVKARAWRGPGSLGLFSFSHRPTHFHRKAIYFEKTPKRNDYGNAVIGGRAGSNKRIVTSGPYCFGLYSLAGFTRRISRRTFDVVQSHLSPFVPPFFEGWPARRYLTLTTSAFLGEAPTNWEWPRTYTDPFRIDIGGSSYSIRPLRAQMISRASANKP